MIFLGWIIISVLNANACTEWLMELCADSLCTVIDIINHDQSRQPSTSVHTHEDGNSSTKWRNGWPHVFTEGLTLTLAVGVSQSCLTLTLLHVFSHTITLTQFVLVFSVLLLLLFLFVFRFWWATVFTWWGSALTFPVGGHLWKDEIKVTTKFRL